MFIVVSGGSGSGKSAFAEKTVMRLNKNTRVYLATMMCRDEESIRRIRRHRAMRRGKGFLTIERPLDLPGLSLPEELSKTSGQAAPDIRGDEPADPGLPGSSDFRGSASCPPDGSGVCVLLECMSNLCANEMFEPEGSAGFRSDHAAARAADLICHGVEHLLTQCEDLVVVSNEVFSDGISYGDGSLSFIRAMAEINRRMAVRADEVYRCVYGIPVRLK